MLQKRFFFLCCLVLACTLLALLSLLPSTAGAASIASGSAHRLNNHQSLTTTAKVKPFINQVDCTGHDDFVKVWTFPSNPTNQGFCFANDGNTSPGFLIQNVQMITSGNNCVVISKNYLRLLYHN